MSDGGKDKKVMGRIAVGWGTSTTGRSREGREKDQGRAARVSLGDSESALRGDRRAGVPAAAGLGGFHVTQLLWERAMASIIDEPGQLSLGSSWKAVDKKREAQFPPGEKIERGHLGGQSLAGEVSCADPQEEGLRGTMMPHPFLPSSHAGPRPTEGLTKCLILPGARKQVGLGATN